jgi:hypothetical protein
VPVVPREEKQKSEQQIQLDVSMMLGIYDIL